MVRRGNEGLLTAEPRLLDDGKTVLVSTFSCGLYLMEGLASDTPSGRLVASFPQKPGDLLRHSGDLGPLLPGDRPRLECRRQPRHQSIPSAPREVSRLTLGPEDVPHWIAISPDQRRVVVTGYAALQHRA